MIPLAPILTGPLVWSKSPNKRGFELKCNGELLGSIQRAGGWSSEFKAESSAGAWKFRRSGWHGGVEIVDSNTGSQVAIFKPGWRGGSVAFSDGQTFTFTSAGFWRPVTTVSSESGQGVLRIHTREKTVEELEELPLSPDRRILLTMIAWHIIQQAAEQAASAGAVVAAIF